MTRRIKRDPPARDPRLLERDGYISSDELAVFLDVPYGTLDQWASRGGGPKFIKIGRERRYWPADVKEWLVAKARKQEARSQERRGEAA